MNDTCIQLQTRVGLTDVARNMIH